MNLIYVLCTGNYAKRAKVSLELLTWYMDFNSWPGSCEDNDRWRSNSLLCGKY